MTSQACDMRSRSFVTDPRIDTLPTKSPTVGDVASQIQRYGNELGLSLSDDQALAVASHLYLMLKKNLVMNLTSVRNPIEATVLHSVDSLLYARVLDDLCIDWGHKKSGQDASSFQDFHTSIQSSDAKVEAKESHSKFSILDMGTGGGFPGIPLACLSESSFVLLDSVGKKVSACQEFLSLLQMESRARAVQGRLEELCLQEAYASSFDCVVARALASLDVLIEYATPYLKRNGYLILSKARPEAHEITAADYTSELCGMALVSRETFELPDGFGHREFFVYQKRNRSKVKLPRKNGEARNKPLSAARSDVSRETSR